MNVTADSFWCQAIPEPNSGCWLWMGSLNSCGYGKNNKHVLGTRSAHRTAYMLANGTIPEGLTVDHLCRVRSCINPDHLDLCTLRENIRRAPKFKGEFVVEGNFTCPSGHSYTPENTRIYKGYRYCRACHRAHVADLDRRKRAAGFVKRGSKWVMP